MLWELATPSYTMFWIVSVFHQDGNKRGYLRDHVMGFSNMVKTHINIRAETTSTFTSTPGTLKATLNDEGK